MAPLTVAEAKQARYWLKRLGLEHLLTPDLLPRKPGRPKHADARMLASLELFLRTAKRERGMSREAALHWMFDVIYKKGKFGSSANAVVARLSRKLREGGFHKRDIKTLVPPEWLERGIDPEKFTTFSTAETDG